MNKYLYVIWGEKRQVHPKVNILSKAIHSHAQNKSNFAR